MKKRWVTSRRSPDRGPPPSGSGEPASPPCQSVEPTSPDNSGGGGASAPAPSLDREGGDKCRRKEEENRHIALVESPVSGSIKISVASNPPDLQGGEVSSAPTAGKKGGKRAVWKTGKKKKSFSSRRLGLHASHSSKQSVAAQGEPLFDEEETSSGLKVEKPKPSSGYHGKISVNEYEDGQSDEIPSLGGQSGKTPSGGETGLQIMVEQKPKPSSGHHGKIVLEQEDGYSGNTPPSMDLIEMTVQDGDIEEHKREQGRARGHAQYLLNVDNETISKKISYFSKRLKDDSPEPNYSPDYEPEELIELYERLALYRIRAYELTVDRKLAALDDVNLKLQYPSSKLLDEGFFEYYEGSLEWYFDPELCKNPHFDDYQRITLRSHVNYLDFERYQSTLNTYEGDLAYVQYCEVLANETKWIEDFIGDSTHKWNRIEDIVYIQALEIAAEFPNVSPFLVSYGFREHIRSMEFDHSYRGLDDLYFEIWKRVAKGKMSFREALLEVHSKDMFPLLSFHIKLELEHTAWGHHLKDFYDAHVAVIDKMASDDKALEFITEAVAEMFPRHRYYLDYAKKKLDIAKDIGLISEGLCSKYKCRLMFV